MRFWFRSQLKNQALPRSGEKQTYRGAPTKGRSTGACKTRQFSTASPTPKPDRHTYLAEFTCHRFC